MHVGTVGQFKFEGLVFKALSSGLWWTLQKFLKGLKSNLKGFLGHGHLQNNNLGA